MIPLLAGSLLFLFLLYTIKCYKNKKRNACAPIPYDNNQHINIANESQFYYKIEYIQKENYVQLFAKSREEAFDIPDKLQLIKIVEPSSFIPKGSTFIKLKVTYKLPEREEECTFKTPIDGILLIDAEIKFTHTGYNIGKIIPCSEQDSIKVIKDIEQLLSEQNRIDKSKQDEDIKKRQQVAIDEKKQTIKDKLLKKQQNRQLEKLATQELIDEGSIFPEANKRPSIPREVVDTVWNRDAGKCVYCGSTENLHLDHIIPFSKGGATNVENLQLLCQKCNLEKSNKIG